MEQYTEIRNEALPEFYYVHINTRTLCFFFLRDCHHKIHFSQSFPQLINCGFLMPVPTDLSYYY